MMIYQYNTEKEQCGLDMIESCLLGVKEGYYGTMNHIYDILQSRGNHFNIEPNMYVPETIRSQGNHYDF